MRYYRLLDRVDIPGRWHLGDVRSSKGTPLDLLDLDRDPPLGERAVIEVTRSGEPLDFCLTSFGVPVIRTSLSAVIGSVAGSDVDLVPVSIAGHDGHALMRSRRVVVCLDEGRSTFVKWTAGDHRPEMTGQYRMVTKLFIDSRRIPSNVRIFRIEGWRIAMIVSEDVRSAIEDAGSVGAKFEAVN